MQFKQFFADERAVSPVIGVILMVAITVILAAVIGTFVLGLGDQVQNTTPQAQFGFDQDTVGYQNNDTSTKRVTITHESGDSVDESDISVTVNGQTAFDVGENGGNTTLGVWNESGSVAAGSSVEVVGYTSTSGDPSGVSLTAGGSTPVWDDDHTLTGSNYNTLSEGDTVRVIYDNPDNDKSATLAKKDVQ